MSAAGGYRWRPLVRATRFKPPSEALVAETMTHYGLPRDEALARLDEETKRTEVYINDLYQVEVRRLDMTPPMIHLNIRRMDGAAIFKDWRHFQQIKNELVGPECEGIELYPAESRKVDTSNKYHMWVVADPKFRFSFGFETGEVRYDTGQEPGLRQRPQSMRVEAT